MIVIIITLAFPLQAPTKQFEQHKPTKAKKTKNKHQTPSPTTTKKTTEPQQTKQTKQPNNRTKPKAKPKQPHLDGPRDASLASLKKKSLCKVIAGCSSLKSGKAVLTGKASNTIAIHNL